MILYERSGVFGLILVSLPPVCRQSGEMVNR
jgi:hypothetical protein